MAQNRTQWDAFEAVARKAAINKMKRIVYALIDCRDGRIGLTEIEKEHIIKINLELQRVIKQMEADNANQGKG